MHIILLTWKLLIVFQVGYKCDVVGLCSGVARILLQGGTGAWRTGSEVRGDKVIQK